MSLAKTQFKYMMWKNWIIIKRNPSETIMDIIYPLILLAVLIGLASSGQNTIYEPELEKPSSPLIDATLSYYGKDLYVAFSPSTTSDCTDAKIKPIVDLFVSKLSGAKSVRYSCYESSDKIVSSAPVEQFTVGFNFEDISTLNENISKPTKYNIMYQSSWASTFIDFSSTYKKPSNDAASLPITTILPFELTMNEALLQLKTQQPVTRLYTSQLFPTYEYSVNSKTDMILYTLPIYFVLIVGYPYIFIVRRLLEERETKVQEGYLMIGLKESVWWATWYVTSFIRNLITAIVVALVSLIIFEKTPFIVLAVSIFIMSFSIMTQSIGLSSLFDKAETGSGVVFMILLLTCMPYYIMAFVPAWVMYLLSFFLPGIGIAVMCALICYADTTGYNGITFSNMFDPAATGQNLNFGLIMLLVLASGICWFFLGLYMNKVIKHAYGVSEDPCFCLQPRFCKNIPAPYTYEQYRDAHKDNLNLDNPNVEPLSENINTSDGLHMVDISKTFPAKSKNDKPTLAVRHFSATFYNNHINVLLGHNGAGKSTLISILTGLYAPTDGDAFLNGSSLVYNKNDIRSVLGVCPQQNVLLNLLTVEEHLTLFGKIRNISDEELKESVNVTLKELGLYEKRNSLVKDLSGGMKRKLSVAIAFIGNPKLIFLDEPTAGMDPVSRRYTWKLLEEKKKDHIIVLCTHFMDEADFLADYIYIMSNGQLQVAGTSLFLKNRFGLGYHLKMNRNSECKDDEVLSTIQSIIPNASIELSTSTDLSVLLPRDMIAHFAPLLEMIKSKAETLHVSNVNMNATTLEEVFVTLAEEQESEIENAARNKLNHKEATEAAGKDDLVVEKTLMERIMEHQQQVVINENNVNIFENVEYESNRWDQFKILLWKKLRSHLNNPKMLVQLGVLPIFTILIGILVLFCAKLAGSTLQDLQLSFNPIEFKTLTYYDNYIHFYDPAGQLGSSLQSYLPYENSNYPILRNGNITDRTAFLQDLLDTGYNAFGLTIETTGPKRDIHLFYNDSFSSILPISVNMIDSYIYNQLMNRQDKQLAIESSFISLPTTASEKSMLTIFLGALFGFYVVAAFAMIPSFSCVDAARERCTGVRLQQRIMGVRALMYWVATILYDYLFSIVPLIAYVVFSCIFFSDTLYVIPTCIVLLLLCLFASLPLAYLCQFMFHSASTAENGVNLIIVFGYMILYILGQAFGSISSLSEVYKYYNYIAYLHPLYATSDAFMKLNTNLPLYPEVIRPSPWDWNFSGLAMVYLAIEGVVFFVLILFVESFTWLNGSQVKTTFEPFEPADEDVQDEIKRIDSSLTAPVVTTNIESPNETAYDPITIAHVLKAYPKTKKQDVVKACRDITFGVKRGECFGLLGPNGAGKTSLLSILTGVSGITGGNVFIEDHPIPGEMEAVYPDLGYCPQFDVLFDFMTVYECLYFYGTIKGIRRDTLNALIIDIMHALGLEEHRNKLIVNLSGGNKRRLCVAIAFMGNPHIVILDEPSTGLDPLSRHKLWDLITSSSKDKSFLLTTHLMEEADYLCDRIGILINGQLECIGTSQHLKSKFGEGYTFDVKVEDDCNYINNMKSWVNATFGESEIRDEHRNHIIFVLSSKNQLEYCFRAIEENKASLHITDYTLSQTTLDQVFLQFAKKQMTKDE